MSIATNELVQPAPSTTSNSRSRGAPYRPRTGTGKRGGGGGKPPQEVIRTWAFDSVGNRKYALQIRKASNGNPCIKIVEGVPQPDGTFRKFDLTIWSEDWPRLFETIDGLRAFVTENNIRTPEGHKFDPNRKPWRKKK
jgi:hypothetical protein